MHNVAFHYSDKIQQMWKNTGVVVNFLVPYTLRTNLIEDFFGETKALKVISERKSPKGHKSHKSLIQRDFESYVKFCVKAIGSRQGSAEGHFRNARLFVEQLPSHNLI